MISNWHHVTLLAIEAQGVVGLRLLRLAAGGPDAHGEALQMIGEKVSAAIEATGTLMTGGSAATVIARYREHVSANAFRLSQP